MGCSVALSGEDSLVRSVSSFTVTVHVNYTVCKKLLQEFICLKDRVRHFSFSLVSILITVLYCQCFLNYY